MNTLFRNPWIVTMNDDFEMIRNGYVYVVEDKISEVGSDPVRMAQLSLEADSVIDAADKILMPGMVSAHTHLFQTFMRGWRPWTGEDYELAHACNSYWAGFARTGKPCGPDLPEWTPYTKENPLTMELGERIWMLEIPENDRITFRKEFLRTGK